MTGAPDVAGPEPRPSLARHTFASLRRPAYRRYFTGNVTSQLGFWLRITVQNWLVYDLTGRKDALGFVMFVSVLPLVMSPLGGVVADRVDRRRLLLFLPLVSVLANLVLGVLVLREEIAIGHIYVLAFLIGSARALEIPTRNAFVRDLVGLGDLQNAVALNAAGFNVARMVGPALGALLLMFFGTGPCFLIAALMNLAMAVAMLGLDVPRGVRPDDDQRPFQQLVEGFRFVRHHPRTRTLMLLLAIAVLFTWSYQTLLVAYAKDQLGRSAGTYGLLLTVTGSGALLGALWVAGRAGRRRSNRKVVFGLVWTGAVLVAILGQVSALSLALPLLFGTGFCQVAFIATSNGLVQESVPDALRGRVMGIWVFCFGTFFPMGGLYMGLVSQRASIALAWGVGALLTGLLSLWLLSALPRRGVGAPRASPPVPPPVSDPGA